MTGTTLGFKQITKLGFCFWLFFFFFFQDPKQLFSGGILSLTLYLSLITPTYKGEVWTV